MSKRAKLRVCASCEWIFNIADASAEGGCPKCEFGHYGAQHVYGNQAYRHRVTQQPWFDRKMGAYADKLHKEIRESKARKPALDLTFT